jgi:aminomethyltransferase
MHLHIKRYIIADQVELEDVTAGTAAIGLEGPGAAAILTALGAPVPATDYAHEAWGDATVAAVSVTGQPGVRIFCPTEKAAAMVRQLEAAGAVAASLEDARLARIENGKPRYGEDIRETSLPQETQQMHGVSFNKGCYLGQEIVERIRAQGRVNKKLTRIVLPGGEIPAAGTKTTVDGAEAEVTSAVMSPTSGEVIALAYVRQR